MGCDLLIPTRSIASGSISAAGVGNACGDTGKSATSRLPEGVAPVLGVAPVAGFRSAAAFPWGVTARNVSQKGAGA
jgi:hypothetical protein